VDTSKTLCDFTWIDLIWSPPCSSQVRGSIVRVSRKFQRHQLVSRGGGLSPPPLGPFGLRRARRSHRPTVRRQPSAMSSRTCGLSSSQVICTSPDNQSNDPVAMRRLLCISIPQILAVGAGVYRDAPPQQRAIRDAEGTFTSSEGTGWRREGNLPPPEPPGLQILRASPSRGHRHSSLELRDD